MRHLILILAILLGPACYSLAQDGPILHTSSIELPDSNAFPLISSPAKIKSPEIINLTLQVLKLNGLVNGDRGKAAFERIAYRPDAGRPGGLLSLQYQVLNSDSLIYSVGIYSVLQGASVYLRNSYYNFNPWTGELIHLSDIFSPAGLDSFLKQSLNRRSASLELVVKDLGTSYELSEVIQIMAKDRQAPYYLRGDSLYVDDVQHLHRSLALMAGVVPTGFALQELKGLLGPLGVSLLAKDVPGVQQFRSATLPQLFSGQSGDRDILAVLSEPGVPEKHAALVFADSGVGYEFADYMDGERFSFEGDYHGQPGRPRLEVVLDPVKTKVEGTFSDTSGTYRLSLNRVSLGRK